jgi:transposase
MKTDNALKPPTSLDKILDHVLDTLPPGEINRTTTPVAELLHVTGCQKIAASPSTTARPKAPTQYALFIGIDWGDRKHDLCSWNPATQQRTHDELEHAPNALHAWMESLHQNYPGQHIAVALEQKTGSLFNFLRDDHLLALYPVNPVTVARSRKAFHPSGAKDDPTDAELILELLTRHRNKLTPLTQEDPLTRELQMLTRKRREAVNLRPQLNNQLKELLKQYFPLFLTICGDDLFAPMACHLLLKYPCFEALQQADPQGLRDFYISHGSRKPALIARRLERIRDAQPLTTDTAVIRPAIMQASMLAELLLTIAESVKGYDKTIANLFARHQDAKMFARFPGAGPILAPRLLAAFGTDRTRFRSPSEVQNTMGISPIKKASGSILLIQWRKACPKFLRQSFQEYADESMKFSIWGRAYYQMQRHRGKRHQAAIRALAGKWIRIMFRCWKTQKPYDELRYMKALQRRHSPLLEYLSKSAEVFGN